MTHNNKVWQDAILSGSSQSWKKPCTVHVIAITVTVAVTEDIAITSIYNIKNGRQSHTVRVVDNVVLF